MDSIPSIINFANYMECEYKHVMGIDISEEVEWLTEAGMSTWRIPYKEVQESQQFFCTFFLTLECCIPRHVSLLSRTLRAALLSDPRNV